MADAAARDSGNIPPSAGTPSTEQALLAPPERDTPASLSAGWVAEREDEGRAAPDHLGAHGLFPAWPGAAAAMAAC